jgi:hypothetical protein
MKTKLGLTVVAASVALVVMGCATQGAKETPSFVLTTPVVELRPGGKVAMYGTGFAPKQEVMLILKDPGGGMSSIGSSLKPAAVANQDGVWAGEFDISGYLRTFKPGTAILTVSDKDWNAIGKAPIIFVAAPPPKPAPQAAAKGAPAKGGPAVRPAVSTGGPTKR